MTRYEFLKRKADLCRLASSRTKDSKVKMMWIQKANELELLAGNLPLVKANARV